MQHLGAEIGFFTGMGVMFEFLIPVENDVAPDRIIAAHYKGNDPNTGIITRTMPLCPYPKMARFTGGNVRKARNWACELDPH